MLMVENLNDFRHYHLTKDTVISDNVWNREVRRWLQYQLNEEKCNGEIGIRDYRVAIILSEKYRGVDTLYVDVDQNIHITRGCVVSDRGFVTEYIVPIIR